MRDHTQFKCTCEEPNCQFCEGGLYVCTVCKGGEGSLPSECPGRKMTSMEQDAVYDGKLDFRSGRWQNRPSKTWERGHCQVAFIAGPYRAPTPGEIYHNIQNARKVAEEMWKLGYAVICPHLNSAFFDGIVSDAELLRGTREILSRCDLVILTPGWEESIGTYMEIDRALREKIPVYIYADSGRGESPILIEYSREEEKGEEEEK